jgi:hypothetical protein
VTEKSNSALATGEIQSSAWFKIRKFGALLRDRILRVVGPFIANQNVIYKLDRIVSPTALPRDFEFRRCRFADELPTKFWEVYRQSQPDVIFEEFARPFSDNAVLSIGLVNGIPASYLWSARFCSPKKEWYVQLEPEDVVIFSVVTFFRFRGLGLARLMVQCVAEAELGVGNIYLDVKRWNRSAQLAFEKGGFRRVAVRPPLPQ